MATDDFSGYCLLSMPTDQVKPLHLLTLKEKKVANTTSMTLSNIFTDSEVPLPLASEDYLVSSGINKSVSVELSIDSHLSLLEGLLKFLKLSGVFKLEKKSFVTVNMIDARRNSVIESEVDAFINSAKLNTKALTFIEMLRKNELFVITDILKCKKYSIQNSAEKNVGGNLEGAAAGKTDAGARFHTSKKNQDSSVNEGEEYITIAVKAFRIKYIKDETTGQESYRIRKDDVIKTIKDDEDFPGELLQLETVTVNRTT
ncbi:MAG TPA: hypothetical protein VIS75_00185 [Chitinophagaceae bacterium]|jgi:hypothetical protein